MIKNNNFVVSHVVFEVALDHLYKTHQHVTLRSCDSHLPLIKFTVYPINLLNYFSSSWAIIIYSIQSVWFNTTLYLRTVK